MTTKTTTKPTKFQYFLWLIGLVLIPIYFIYEKRIESYYYNKSQCDEPRQRAWQSFDVPIPAGYMTYGLDVSHYSCGINWTDVKKMNDNGRHISFAYMRATRGLHLLDYQFLENWTTAKEAQMRRGAYHFYTFRDDAEAQAAFFLKYVTIEKGDLPPVLDIENDKTSADNRLNRVEILRGIQKWLDIVERETGMRPMIYTNLDYYKRYISGNFTAYPIWIASYNNLKGVILPDNKPWWFWQFSEKARCKGISERIDLNIFAGSEAQLWAISKK